MLNAERNLIIASTKDSSLEEELKTYSNVYHDYNHRIVTSYLDTRELIASETPGEQVLDNMTTVEILKDVSR